jgi:ribonuclease HI
MGEQDFIKWRSGLGMHSLTFDGASKGNPGAVGGGGILLDPSDTLEVTYSWGLGVETNNMAEALVLWQGLRLAASKSIQNLVVFGDSRVIIQAMKTRRRPNNLKLSQLLRKLFLLLQKFQKINFYHIL